MVVGGVGVRVGGGAVRGRVGVDEEGHSGYNILEV